MDKENVLMMAVEGLQDSEGLEDLVRSPRTHRATVSDAEFKNSWQEADAAGAGLNLLQTCENEEMVYAFDLCSKHLGADMQQATQESCISCCAITVPQAPQATSGKNGM